MVSPKLIEAWRRAGRSSEWIEQKLAEIQEYNNPTQRQIEIKERVEPPQKKKRRYHRHIFHSNKPISFKPTLKNEEFLKNIGNKSRLINSLIESYRKTLEVTRNQNAKG